jgi:uncharacterized protein (TIGR02266 family)
MTDAQVEIPHDERRVHERVPLQVEVSLTSENNFYTGFTSDISEGGLFVATRETVPLGTEVGFEMKLGSGKVNVTGVVRWARPYNPLNEDVAPGVGVEFVNLHPKVAQIINAFIVKRRDSIFYDDEDNL